MTMLIDLTGQRFSRLYVVKLATTTPRVKWECRCDCGNVVSVAASQLRSGHTRSCGCLHRETGRSRASALTGRRFGRLIVLERAPNKSYTENSVWRCRCECGNEAVVVGIKLTGDKTLSCGCLRRERQASGDLNRSHGMSNSREFHAWAAAIQRCHNPKNLAYSRYGGRGIAVWPEWRNSFEAFLRDVGPAPTQRHSIDRIDGAKGYEPGNCRWADAFEQANNVKTNRRLTHDNRTMTVAQWERHLGVSAGRIKARLLAGWSVERALTTPVR